MFTYVVKKRVFRIRKEGEEFKFPSEVEVSFHLQPLSAFGKSHMCGRTVIKNGQVPEFCKFIYDANTGRTFHETNPPLVSLAVDFKTSYGHLVLNGNIITIKSYAQNINELYSWIETLYFAIPLLLNVEFADPPVVERVAGKVGQLPFTWEVARRNSPVEFVSKGKQEQKVSTAWKYYPVLSFSRRRRLIGALHYFHVACRLLQAGNTPGEFLSEALLNFYKVIEVLYGSKRDEVRKSLTELGFSSEEIERDFIPVMLLRSSFDVGHPLLKIFTHRQLETLQIYAERAEEVMRKLLNKILSETESGKLEIPPYEVEHVDAKTQEIIEAIRSKLDSFELEQGSGRG